MLVYHALFGFDSVVGLWVFLFVSAPDVTCVLVHGILIFWARLCPGARLGGRKHKIIRVCTGCAEISLCLSVKLCGACFSRLARLFIVRELLIFPVRLCPGAQLGGGMVFSVSVQLISWIVS